MDRRQVFPRIEDNDHYLSPIYSWKLKNETIQKKETKPKLLNPFNRFNLRFIVSSPLKNLEK